MFLEIDDGGDVIVVNTENITHVKEGKGGNTKLSFTSGKEENVNIPWMDFLTNIRPCLVWVEE